MILLRMNDLKLQLPNTSVHTKVFANKNLASAYIAKIVASTIHEKEANGKQAVLGLATGSTPIPLYDELVRLHNEENLSFKNVIAFNLDEYYPMQPTSKHSYYYFMRQHLFDRIDLSKVNYFLPNGALPEDELANHTLNYEQMIHNAGGLDLQILGIGRNGHIGFNEPGSTADSLTRVVHLTQSTKEANAFDFGSPELVPDKAITMGIKTILNARKIVLMAWGKSKAEAIRKSILEAPNTNVPASLLQHHADVTFVLDEEAASALMR